jgi:para-aminobenzoate synthetase/4-amino-4-deoxychorismate lyase
MVDLLQPDPAQGVFETLLVVRGAPRELDAHLERLRASLRALYGVALPAVAHELACERAAGVALGRLRLSLTPQGEGAPRVEAVAQPVDRVTVLPGWELALDLRSVAADGWDGGHKWADRRLLERLDADAAPECALLVDRERGVLETTRANVFALTGGALVTPPLDGAILPGVTRAVLIEAAISLGIEVREEPLALAALRAADAVLLTGSLRLLEARAAGGAAHRVLAALAAAVERAGEAEVD